MFESFNVSETERFIDALTGSVITPVTWQLFTDQKVAEDPFAHIYHASIQSTGLADELKFRNKNGVGIFAMINAGDGAGRAERNVVAARALFVDDDESVLTIGSPELAPLPPSMTVQSAHGQHHYWLLGPGEDLARFTPAQQALAAHFGTDPKVSDLARVMRVPGFWHMKDPKNPVLVRLLQADPTRLFTIDEVLTAFGQPNVAAVPMNRRAAGPAPTAGRKPRIQQGAHPSSSEAIELLALFPTLALVRWATANPNEVSREAWRGIATNIGAIVVECPLVADEAERLFHRISEGYDTYDANETQRVFRNALRSAETHGPMTFDTLLATGTVPAEACAHRAIGRSPLAVARAILSLSKRGR